MANVISPEKIARYISAESRELLRSVGADRDEMILADADELRRIGEPAFLVQVLNGAEGGVRRSWREYTEELCMLIDSQPSANTYNVDGIYDEARAARLARSMFIGDTVVMGDQMDEPSHNALLRTLHQRGLGLAYSARSDDRLTEAWRVVAIDHPEAI